jgi:hypothetical protein
MPPSHCLKLAPAVRCRSPPATRVPLSLYLGPRLVNVVSLGYKILTANHVLIMQPRGRTTVPLEGGEMRLSTYKALEGGWKICSAPSPRGHRAIYRKTCKPAAWSWRHTGRASVSVDVGACVWGERRASGRAKGFSPRLLHPRRAGSASATSTWGAGHSIHVEPSAPHLGSLLTSDGKDDEDVALRIHKATRQRRQSTTRSSSRCCSTLYGSLRVLGTDSAATRQAARLSPQVCAKHVPR